MNQALKDIAAERKRQMEKEGWTPEHDDGHAGGQLSLAAACYAAFPYPVAIRTSQGEFVDAWPWNSFWDKRLKHDQRRRKVIAAALLVAEIERMDRAAKK